MRTLTYIFPVVLLLISGCASVHTIKQNGTVTHQINCSGKLVNMSVCYKKAAQVCPNGYRVVSHKIHPQNNFPLNTSLGIATAISNSIPGVVKGIVVQCK